MTAAAPRDRRPLVRALALVTLVAIAPRLLVAWSASVPGDPAGGPTLDASSLALGGVHRLVVAGHPPRVDLAVAARIVPAPLGVRCAGAAARPPAPVPAALEQAPRGADENRRY
ncbi:MAG: hypothetical protein U1E39_13665 [Planctomycetota bacterium]